MMILKIMGATKLQNHFFKTVGENPNLLKERDIIKNGKITRI